MEHALSISFACSVIVHGVILLGPHAGLIEQPKFGVELSADFELIAPPPPKNEEPSVQDDVPPPAPKLEEFTIPDKEPDKPKQKPTPKPKATIKPAPPQTASRAHTSDTSSTNQDSSGVNTSTVRVEASPSYFRNPPPDYPETARRNHVEGVVRLLVVVSSEGEAESVIIVSSSSSELLDAAALRAVKRWRFKPGTLGGLPVESRVEVPIRFQLKEK